MSQQIAVRLEDDLVAFLDQQTREGRASSRAAVVRTALRRLMREEAHRRDAEIYAREGTDPDLVLVVEHTARHAVPLDD